MPAKKKTARKSAAKKAAKKKSVETLVHDEAKRKNIPTAEHQSVLEAEQKDPKTLRYPRNTDLRRITREPEPIKARSSINKIRPRASFL